MMPPAMGTPSERAWQALLEGDKISEEEDAFLHASERDVERGYAII